MDFLKDYEHYGQNQLDVTYIDPVLCSCKDCKLSEDINKLLLEIETATKYYKTTPCKNSYIHNLQADLNCLYGSIIALRHMSINSDVCNQYILKHFITMWNRNSIASARSPETALVFDSNYVLGYSNP